MPEWFYVLSLSFDKQQESLGMQNQPVVAHPTT